MKSHMVSAVVTDKPADDSDDDVSFADIYDSKEANNEGRDSEAQLAAGWLNESFDAQHGHVAEDSKVESAESEQPVLDRLIDAMEESGVGADEAQNMIAIATDADGHVDEQAVEEMVEDMERETRQQASALAGVSKLLSTLGT